MDDQLTGIVKELCAHFPASTICAVETGTIRDADEASKSTLVISEALGDRGGLISVDNSMESINISKEVCSNAPNVIWELSDSVDYIKKTTLAFHFAYLDSKNDAQHIFEEFKAIVPRMVMDGGVILIDNAGIPDDGISKAQKGVKIYKFLNDINVPSIIHVSKHGNRLKITLNSDSVFKILRGLDNND